MAIVTTVRGVVNSADNTTAYPTSAFTPAAGEMLVAFFEFSAPDGSTSVTDSQGGSWTLILSTTRTGGTGPCYCYVRNSAVSASSMTVTFNNAPVGAIGCNGMVLSMTGTDGVGSGAVVQSKSANNSSTTTPEVTFDSTTVTTNATLGAVFCNTNPAGATPPTGWTEGSDIGHGSPNSGGESIYRDSGFAGTVVTWGATESDWAAIVIEVRAGSAAAASTVLAPVIAVNNPIPPTLIGSQCDKNSGTQTLSCTASVSALVKVVLFVTHDPGITVTSITDSKGNLYVLDGSIVNGSGTSGVTTTCYAANLAFALTSGVDTITANFSASRGAACMAAMGVNLNFSVDEGNNTHADTGTAPSTTITPVGNPSMGFVCCGVEGPDGDTYTEDADWTAVLNTGTTGGAADSNVSLNMAFVLIGTAAATPYTPTLGTSRLFAQYEVIYSYADADPAIAAQQFLPIMGIGG